MSTGQPQAKWQHYSPGNPHYPSEGAKSGLGQPVETRYDCSKADVVVSLDADFLYAGWPGNVRYIRDFALRRDPDIGQMNRLYAIESTPSATGAKADHRSPMRASEIEKFAQALSSHLPIKPPREGVAGDNPGFAWSIVQEL